MIFQHHPDQQHNGCWASSSTILSRDESTQTTLQEEQTLTENRAVEKDSQGFEIIRVEKNKPSLGLAIEGGVDTEQNIPRIINIAADGAAAEEGALRVGQLIREVDGKNVEGKLFIF